MKKVFLTIGMFIFSVSVFAQIPINSDDLVGWWFSDSNERCNLFFWTNINKELKLQEVNCTNGEGFIIRGYEFDTMSVRMRSSPVCCVDNITRSEYSLIDYETIHCKTIDENTEKTTITYYTKHR